MAKTALVIDDNPLVRTFVEVVLGQAGFAVILAPTAQAALDVVSTTRLDLILLDVMLPDMSGVRLLTLIRTQRRIMTPVMMMTGKVDPQTVKACIGGGANSYLVKPFGPNDLLARVHSTLNPRRAATSVDPQLEVAFI